MAHQPTWCGAWCIYTHPLKKRCYAAGYVQKLNTNEQLYRHLVRSLDKHSSMAGTTLPESMHAGSAVAGYTPEALRVGRTLKHDFEKAGIHLPEEQRSRLTGLIDLERRIGMQIGMPCSSLSQPKQHSDRRRQFS